MPKKTRKYLIFPLKKVHWLLQKTRRLLRPNVASPKKNVTQISTRKYHVKTPPSKTKSHLLQHKHPISKIRIPQPRQNINGAQSNPQRSRTPRSQTLQRRKLRFQKQKKSNDWQTTRPIPRHQSPRRRSRWRKIYPRCQLENSHQNFAKKWKRKTR